MKKIIALVLTCTVLFMMSACGQKENPNTESGKVVKVEIENSLDEYISKLPSDSARTSFKLLWNTVINTGNLLVRKMAGNTEKYEFDPTVEIPAEVLEKFDFKSLLNNRDLKNHKDFKIVIEGESVTIEFDGIQFYPSKYDIMDVEEYIEKHSTDVSENVEE